MKLLPLGQPTSSKKHCIIIKASVRTVKNKMFHYIFSLNCILLLLWQLISITNFTRAQGEILKGMIRDGGKEIHINWKKTKQLLVNEHLPVWFANTQRDKSCRFSPTETIHEIQQNFVKENIGEFIFYQDLKTLSAVVYFKNTKTLNGIIDIRYIIKEMPVSQCNQGHEVGGPYVKHREGSLNIHDYLKPFNAWMHSNAEPNTVHGGFPAPNEYQTPRKRQRFNDHGDESQVTTLYPEILIFVPYGMITFVQQANLISASAYILKYYMIQFNSIDMLFAKLSTDNIKIHINLAGIVFESKAYVFNFLKSYDVQTPFNVYGFNQQRYLNGGPTLASISSYINRHQNTFPQDSFDFYFVTTANAMWVNGDVCQGISLSIDYYGNRKLLPPLERTRLGLIVQYSGGCDYVIAAHEIGHLLYLEHEPQDRGCSDGMKQCYAIMQETNPYCIDCLKWTDKNIEDLKKFVKENRNHCFLLNKPRSLHPHGHRIKMLSRLDQCRCYGFGHWPIKESVDYLDEIPQNACARETICGQNFHEVNTLLPLDGTPCAKDKVCWNGACQAISISEALPLQGQSNSNK